MSKREESSQLVSAIRAGRAHLLAACAGLTDEALRLRPSEDEWSIIEVVAHLADVDRHWLGQALAIRDNAQHIFVHFDDERWKAEHLDVRQQPVAEILLRTGATHETVLRALSHLSDADLRRAAKHPRGVTYTVGDVFLRYVRHDENHAEQIAAIRARIGA